MVGLLYSLLTIGLAISFRFLNYPDLTLEGSVIFGAATALLVLNAGYSSFLSLFAGALAGAVAGLITALLATRLGVSRLLSGIVTTAILYSVNIRFLGLRSNVLLQKPGFFDYWNKARSANGDLVILLLLVAVGYLFLVLVFRVRLGFLLRVAGDNERYLVDLGENASTAMVVGLVLANSVIGFGGAILVNYKQFVDINMSFGLLIGALAAMMIGEALVRAESVPAYLVGCIAGTLVYNFAIAAVLFAWTDKWERYIVASDVRFFTGMLLVIPALIRLKRQIGLQLFRSEW